MVHTIRASKANSIEGDEDTKLANRLKEIRDAYPLEDQFAVWVYAIARDGDKAINFTKDHLLEATLPKLKKHTKSIMA